MTKFSGWISPSGAKKVTDDIQHLEGFRLRFPESHGSLVGPIFMFSSALGPKVGCLLLKVQTVI